MKKKKTYGHEAGATSEYIPPKEEEESNQGTTDNKDLRQDVTEEYYVKKYSGIEAAKLKWINPESLDRKKKKL